MESIEEAAFFVTADKVISLLITHAHLLFSTLHCTCNIYSHRHNPEVKCDSLRWGVWVHDVDMRQRLHVGVKVKCRGKVLNTSGPQLSNGATIWEAIWSCRNNINKTWSFLSLLLQVLRMLLRVGLSYIAYYFIYIQTVIVKFIKGMINPKMWILWSFTHVFQTLKTFVSSQHRFYDENIYF